MDWAIAHKYFYKVVAWAIGNIFICWLQWQWYLFESVYRDILKFMKINNKVGTTIGHKNLHDHFQDCGKENYQIRLV